jgi:hypothetical protein
MKKLSILTLISTLSCGAPAHAGAMGDVDSVPCLSSFFLLEGGYASNQLKGYDFNLTDANARLKSKESNKNYAGIFSAGLIRAVNEEFAISSEIGYGIYGRTDHTPNVIGLADYSIKHTLSGFDALAGVAYTDPDYSLFLKAGALVETRTTKTSADLTAFSPFVAKFKESVNHTAVLPAIKVGGSYNFNNNWAVTLSYLRAFGTNPKTTGNINATSSTFTFTNDIQNPSIDAVLLGLQVMI